VNVPTDTLHPLEARRLLSEAAEKGLSGGVAVVVGGALPEAMGRRSALVGPPFSAGEYRGTLGDPTLDGAAFALLAAKLRDPSRPSGLRRVESSSGDVELFVEIVRPVPELVIVGAGHVARPLALLAAMVGFRVTVVDDRPGFAAQERFPEATRLLTVDFDHPFRDIPLSSASHVILVTRGHRYDYACLISALRSSVSLAYVGMIGSRRRVRATYLQLVEDGFSPQELSRIHAPIGLDIGAETPEEIAVAVVAELVLIRRGGSGRSLARVGRVAERFFGKQAVGSRSSRP